jgi:hypothetical protein
LYLFGTYIYVVHYMVENQPSSMILKLKHAPQLGGGMHEVTLESFAHALSNVTILGSHGF